MSAKVLMIQGAMSGAGKSLLVTGLCRVLAQDGLRVAPFKSQNMALNSAVTPEGLEIGRAQAVQAEAAGVAPIAAMNPVLLKPTSDTGSQVVVNGRPIGTMAAREFFSFRHRLREPIMEAYRTLAEAYDVVLIEGAGSPVELNLQRDDIVNMGVARMTNAPVLLVGDIDRGGVFAQLIGTYLLLDDEDRQRVRASVVNKFRGDASLFDDGIAILQERMGVPVAGVVPYLQLDLDDEDSVSDRLDARSHGAPLDIAVIRLPRIANFTDFIALEACEGVGVRYVRRPSELGSPDLLILPGTKATMADLRWLRTCGLADALCEAAAAGVPVLGICGGYQMLGTSIADPSGVEDGGEQPGLGLLPVRTVFGTTKRTTQTEATFCPVAGPLSALGGVRARGYEIHMGSTLPLSGVSGDDKMVSVCVSSDVATPLLLLGEGDERRYDGCQRANVYGCYLHGLFDEPAVCEALVAGLAQRKGVDLRLVGAVDMGAYRQGQYDKLAAGLRASLNMDLVYRIIEEGV